MDPLSGFLLSTFGGVGWLLFAGIAFAVIGAVIGLSRIGVYTIKGSIHLRDAGIKIEVLGYGVMIIGLLLTGSATNQLVANGSPLFFGGSPFPANWYCLNPVQTLTQNCGYVTSSNSTLCTSTATSAAGGSCERELLEWGQASCTVAGAGCLTPPTIVFPTPFSASLYPLGPQLRCFINQTTTFVTGSIYQTVSFFTNTTTIYNMPAAKTAILGTQHYFKMLVTPTIGSIELGGSITKASQNTTAVMILQYSLNGATFFDVANSNGVPLTFDFGHTGFRLAALISPAISSAFGVPTWWRLVTQGGKGSGDSPAFSEMFMNLVESSFSTMTPYAIPDLVTPTTQFQCNVLINPPAPAGALNAIAFDWEAYVCKDGSQSC